MFMGVLPACISVYHMHAVLEEASGGHLDTLELALAVLSCHVDARESNLGLLEGPPAHLTDSQVLQPPLWL